MFSQEVYIWCIKIAPQDAYITIHDGPSLAWLDHSTLIGAMPTEWIDAVTSIVSLNEVQDYLNSCSWYGQNLPSSLASVKCNHIATHQYPALRLIATSQSFANEILQMVS